MTGERGLDGDLRGLEVTDLTDHDDVWILTKERAQRGCEVQADILVHLHLIDATEVELHGIFRGRQVVGDRVQLG